jgi:hypothetical protein
MALIVFVVLVPSRAYCFNLKAIVISNGAKRSGETSVIVKPTKPKVQLALPALLCGLFLSSAASGIDFPRQTMSSKHPKYRREP